MTIARERVDSVTEVLRESEVGLPKGPAGSLRIGRPSRLTVSLRIPANDSPWRPRRRVTGGVTFAASYSPIGNRYRRAQRLQRSTAFRMRGRPLPCRTRRRSASEDGRVRVGSIPNAL